MRTPAQGLSVPIYAAAHFGKSLWWNGSELFLAFFLTEYLALSGISAAIGIAIGLALGAFLDIAVARHRAWFVDVARAGRVQMAGAIGAAVSVVILATAPLATGTERWVIVVGANLVFRLAYVFYDLPQNCLLSLVRWSPDVRRKAAAARAAAGSMALVIVSLGIMIRASPAGRAGTMAFVLGAITIALATAAALLANCRGRAGQVLGDKSGPRCAYSTNWGTFLMAATCLTVPAFGKLVPYLSIGASKPLIGMPLLVLAAATGGSQIGWPTVISAVGEARSTAVAGGLLLAGAACIRFGTVVPASLLIGTASGALATIIWSHVAIATAGRDPLDVAPAFARLTATAKLALAVLALAIGELLDAGDYHRQPSALLPMMAASTLAGGILILLFAVMRRWPRRETLAGSA